MSNSQRVYGVGINDSADTVTIGVDGKKVTKPDYRVWQSMLARCYSEKYHHRQPTYVGCTVVEIWHRFSNFKSWYNINYIEGYHLDKDILIPGNKLYSPETCCFVSRAVNSLLNSHSRVKGPWPQGVCYEKKSSRFMARISINGRRQYLGCYDNPEAAYADYANAKAQYIEQHANAETRPRIKEALLKRAKDLA